MPKDALGHGSNERGGPAVGTHAAAVQALPGHGSLAYKDMSEPTYHSSMPPDTYTGMVQDMLGLWSGSQKPDPLSEHEAQQVKDSYAQRDDFRSVAQQIKNQRRTYAETVSKPDVRGPK
jgi:hypothetical protein